MVLGKSGRTARSSRAAVSGVVVVQVSMCAAVSAAAVIFIISVASGWGGVNGLDRYLGPGLSGGVEGLRAGVVLRPELHGGLHGDLRLLGEAVAAVGGRGAAVPGGRRAIRGRGGSVGGRGAVAAAVRPVQVRLRLHLDHTIGTRAAERKQRWKNVKAQTAVKVKRSQKLQNIQQQVLGNQ